MKPEIFHYQEPIGAHYVSLYRLENGAIRVCCPFNCDLPRDKVRELIAVLKQLEAKP